MSFDIFIQAFHRGVPAGISKATLREIFSPHLVEVDASFWRLDYGDPTGPEVSLSDPSDTVDAVRGIAIHGSPQDLRFYDALVRLLSSGDLVLFFPGGRGPILARDSVVGHLPTTMLEALGQPIVVAVGSDISREISEA